MKKNMLTGALVIASIASYSQNVSWFEAEQSSYYEVTGCAAHAPVRFYSQTGGGSMLKEVKANNEGRLLMQEDVSFQPAFALNRANGIVRFFREKEFSVQQFRMEEHGDDVQISWQAIVNPDEDVSFEVLKSEDGIHFKNFALVAAQRSSGTLRYAVNDDIGDAGFYKVNVINSKKGIRYTSKIISPDYEQVTVYPTATKDWITVVVPQTSRNAAYKIINAAGKAVGTGMLKNTSTTIPVEQLAAGSYYIIIRSANKNIACLFLKQ